MTVGDGLAGRFFDVAEGKLNAESWRVGGYQLAVFWECHAGVRAVAVILRLTGGGDDEALGPGGTGHSVGEVLAVGVAAG